MSISPQEAGRQLFEGARQGSPWPEALRGRMDLETGYRAQREVLAHHLANGERQAGWKIGFTADSVRKHFGTDAPVFGYLLERGRYASGHRFAFDALTRPSIESELCFTLAAPLEGPGVTPEGVLDALLSVAPAFEIIEARGNMAEDLGMGVADNVSQWGYVVGEPVQPYPRDLDLAALRARITRNGQVEVDTLGRDAIDNQLASIAWLANQVARFGGRLEAGHVVMSGSFSKPLPISKGDAWETHFSDVGTVQATFE